MIASENFVPQAVLECQGSVLTNKYAEGYPGRRYYGGCEFVDVAEQLAIDRAKALFGAEHANVQPHSGAQANTAVYHALLQPGDTIMGLSSPHGGHLTHGMKINVSGRLYDIARVRGRPRDDRIDMDEVARHRPASASRSCCSPAGPRIRASARLRALPRDRRRGRRAADGRHGALRRPRRRRPAPEPGAARRRRHDARSHKTIGGARGGLILCREEYAKKIDSAVFPGQQGGPLEHVIAGKAVAFKIAADRGLQRAPAAHASTARKALAEELLGAGHGVNVLTGGTDVHLVLVDLRESELDGQQAEDRLHEIGITVNRNAVPFDPRPPMVTSGPARRHAGARDARPAGRRLPRDRHDHRRRAVSPASRAPRRADRARRRDRRPLPAVRAPRRARRSL